jgi:hypothetical protein
MQACAAYYDLTYLTTPILQLAERVVGLSAVASYVPFSWRLLVQYHIYVDLRILRINSARMLHNLVT